MPKKGQKMTPAEQVKAFQKAARELGCDDNEKGFDEKLKKVATASRDKGVKRKG